MPPVWITWVPREARYEGRHAGHHAAVEVAGAHDQTGLHAGVECHADREQGNLDLNHLVGRERLDPVEAVGRDLIYGQVRFEMTPGHTQPSARSLVAQDRRALLGQVVERTIGWLNRCRRPPKDWERTTRKARAFLFLASIRIMT